MTRARLKPAAFVIALLALTVPPTAQAQLGGLVSRAKQAVRPDKPDAAPASGRSVQITSENIDAFIRGVGAERAEVHRLDSLEAVASSTPEMLRQIMISQCSMSGVASSVTPLQAHQDSARLREMIAGVDTARMRKLVAAAQNGDAAAMAELTAIGRNMMAKQLNDPNTMARAQQAGKAAEESQRRADKCVAQIPPPATLEGRIQQAKTEMARYGSRTSPSYTNHLSSVKLSAAGGAVSAAQFAAVEERIRGYLTYPATATPNGFTEAEQQALRTRRAELERVAN